MVNTNSKKLTIRNFNNSSGFTLIEIIVSTTIIAVISTIVLLQVVQYINRGKDSNIHGNIIVLIPAGEKYYNQKTGYVDFCNSEVVSNAKSSLPEERQDQDSVICRDGKDRWVACVQEFSNNIKAFCVDSRGVKRQIENRRCENIRTANCDRDIALRCQCP